MRGVMGILLALMLTGQAWAAIDTWQFKDEAQEQAFREITSQLRCPKCQNNSIADSNAMIAADMRQKVYELMQLGKPKGDVYKRQGESYRIMYLHVPAAMWSMGLYLAMAVAAFIGVVWQIKMADLAIAGLAPVGAVCTLVALVSGAAWGKPMWGTWWIWDARLTSELVLLFLYAGVIALWHAFDDRRMAGRAAGILVLVGVVNLPIICLLYTSRCV